MLFQRFDRLLFLAKDGKTIYFGDIGEDSEILSSYFERNRAARLEPGDNPAEWMLDVIGAAPLALIVMLTGRRSGEKAPSTQK